MGLRFFFSALTQVLLASVVWWLFGAGAAVAAVLLSAWSQLLWENWAAQRVLRWLRKSPSSAEPDLGGNWGEAATRMRRQLREYSQRTAASDARLQEILAALQASPNGITLLDERGAIEWCNHIAQAHFGFEGERDTLQSIGNLLRAPEFSAYLAAHDFSADVVLAGRASSPERPVKISAQIFPYGDGRKLLLSRDITALEQAEAMRRDFVANVSHEIRTPLTVLVGFVETLQTLDLSAKERHQYLDLMAQQGTRMQNLVNDLLALSRLHAAPLRLEQVLIQRLRVLQVLRRHTHEDRDARLRGDDGWRLDRRGGCARCPREGDPAARRRRSPSPPRSPTRRKA